jgi:hypothetical protein
VDKEEDLRRLDQIQVSDSLLSSQYLCISHELKSINSLCIISMLKLKVFLQLNKLRPEFRSGLDALTRFVFERTRPKQVGATIMTGPVLVGILQSYLDALNNGAVPTISSSWQVCICFHDRIFLLYFLE